MSDTTQPTADEPRPWHGSSDPWESIYQWVESKMQAAHARIAALEEQLAGAMQKSTPVEPTQKEPVDAQAQEPPTPAVDDAAGGAAGQQAEGQAAG